jgi:uncharacterized repeat protein (TIGR01451 family)
MSTRSPFSALLIIAALGIILFSQLADAQSWNNHSRDSQHTALSSVASQPLNAVRWQTPVDLNPQYSGSDLLIHYGSPLITLANTIIVPVKTGASGGFRVEGRNGANGSLIWTQTTDYILPPHNWTPSYSPTLTPSQRLYFAGAGGTVFYRDNLDANSGATGRLAFYGISNYNLNPGAYNSAVFINTPITSDAAGNIYFGFQVTGTNSLNLQSGVARIASNGVGSLVSASSAAADAAIIKVVHNCAPALSNDGSTLYIAVSTGNFGRGFLLALNSSSLATSAKVALKDAASGNDALLPDDGTASPTVGPDGDVYFGVLENPFPSNHDRGWLLHFSGNLSQTRTAGAFGWDDTASIVPASIVPTYTGSSSYVLMTKYNNYAGSGGDGVNKIAILDPNAAMVDPVTGATVMKEVLTIAGVTHDDDFPNNPNAVREWCINTAVVDPFTKSVLANSEDGRLYRWDLAGNAFPEAITLTPGIGEAYTPTLIGPDGTVYAINNATLFAVGNVSELGVDVAISQTASPNPVVAGSNLACAITVTNRGTGNAASVVVTDNLPASVTFVSCASTGNGVCGGSANNRTVTFSSLPAGASETITLVARVNCPASNGAMIANSVMVTSSTHDPNTSNNSATTTVTISNPPPTLTGCPKNLSVPATSSAGAVVTFPSPTVSDNCPGATVACSPPSGSTFPIGQTTVLCTGTDTSGYTATCSFKVTVRKQSQR